MDSYAHTNAHEYIHRLTQNVYAHTNKYGHNMALDKMVERN